MPSANRPLGKYRHVFAVVRTDVPVNQDAPENSITVVMVLSSEESAELETDRLNRINADKHCTYFMCITHMVD